MRMLATRRSFISGRLVPRGHVVEVPEEQADRIASDTAEKQKRDKKYRPNLVPAGDIGDVDVVQIAALSPTGPNPQNPQQIPPDAVQTVEGYLTPGARLVGETTAPAETRIDGAGLAEGEQKGTQEKVQDELAKAGDREALAANRAAALLDDGDDRNVSNDAVEGTVADVVATIDTSTDLDALEAAEKDREKPRQGVLKAIEAERARRSA
jgi:hypothetical protein